MSSLENKIKEVFVGEMQAKLLEILPTYDNTKLYLHECMGNSEARFIVKEEHIKDIAAIIEKTFKKPDERDEKEKLNGFYDLEKTVCDNCKTENLLKFSLKAKPGRIMRDVILTQICLKCGSFYSKSNFDLEY